MNLQRFLATWAGLTLENRVNRLIILLLIGVNCVLAVTINQTDRTVVLVPPVLEGEVSVARSSASREVREAWALFVAELLGNVTPTNADFLTKALEPLLAPALRVDVLRVLDAQVAEIRREKVSLAFEPRADQPGSGERHDLHHRHPCDQRTGRQAGQQVTHLCPARRVQELSSGRGLPGFLSRGAAHRRNRWEPAMTRQPTLLALCVSLALGTAQAAPEPDSGIAIPRVSCDLLDVRTTAAGRDPAPTRPGPGRASRMAHRPFARSAVAIRPPAGPAAPPSVVAASCASGWVRRRARPPPSRWSWDPATSPSPRVPRR